MGLDIKIPIGLMFAIYGIVLTIFGLVTNNDPELYQKSLEFNINLWSGVFMVAFGGMMLVFAMITRKRKKEAAEQA